MFMHRHSSWKSWLSKFFPWSDRILIGVPKKVKIWSTRILATVTASWFLMGKAKANFEKESMAVRMYTFPRLLFGWGPVISMLITSHGMPTTIGCSSPCFGGLLRQYLTQGSHALQYLSTIFDHPGQYTRLRTCSFVLVIPKWPPVIPWCDSSTIFNLSTTGAIICQLTVIFSLSMVLRYRTLFFIVVSSHTFHRVLVVSSKLCTCDHSGLSSPCASFNR